MAVHRPLPPPAARQAAGGDRFRRGDAVVIRHVREWGQHGVAVGAAFAGLIIADGDDVSVVCTTAGSAVRTRAGSGEGPRGRIVLPDSWNGEHESRTWTGDAVVRVHRRGQPWSVWRWHDGRRWTHEWYGNLELPWTRSAVGFDTQDWVLDVVVQGEHQWTVQFKDEDELAWMASIGAVTEAEVNQTQRAGRSLVEAARARRWPFDADWTQWVPDPSWRAVPMPAGWQTLQS